MEGRVSCDMVAGEEPFHQVWESEEFLSILSIYPNTKGVTVVTPKEHYDSYISKTLNSEKHGLLDAAEEVASKLDSAFRDVGRTAAVLEGYGVNHIHAKLFRIQATDDQKWEPIESENEEFFEEYRGFVSSHDAEMEEEQRLGEIEVEVREA